MKSLKDLLKKQNKLKDEVEILDRHVDKVDYSVELKIDKEIKGKEKSKEFFDNIKNLKNQKIKIIKSNNIENAEEIIREEIENRSLIPLINQNKLSNKEYLLNNLFQLEKNLLDRPKDKLVMEYYTFFHKKYYDIFMAERRKRIAGPLQLAVKPAFSIFMYLKWKSVFLYLGFGKVGSGVSAGLENGSSGLKVSEFLNNPQVANMITLGFALMFIVEMINFMQNFHPGQEGESIEERKNKFLPHLNDKRNHELDDKSIKLLENIVEENKNLDFQKRLSYTETE